MAQVYVGIGSNLDPQVQLPRAFSFFKDYPNVIYSSVYRSRALGFTGPDFYNAVVGFTCKMPLSDLIAQLLKEENTQCAGTPHRFADRALDLDLLLYGERICYDEHIQLPRSDIVKYPFVLGPLAQIAPDVRHPVLDMTYQQLWAATQPAFKAVITPCATLSKSASSSQL